MEPNEPIPRAPVTEALFDIQVELPQDIRVDTLEQLCDSVQNEYPTKQSRRRFEGRIELKADQVSGSESIDLGIDGFLGWSEDSKQVVQFRFDGFSYSRLKPYIDWEQHFPNVVKYWRIYSEKTSPIKVKRIALRYINLIAIPFKFHWEDCFINFPKLPLERSTLSNFFNRLEFLLPEESIKAIVTQKLALSNDPIHKSAILDIEVVKKINSQISEESIADVFDLLREVKNDVFFKSLHSKTMELFK